VVFTVYRGCADATFATARTMAAAANRKIADFRLLMADCMTEPQDC
jgi:hypothetical protein